MALNNKMGARHEEDLLKLLGGRGTKGSGSTWKDQADGRHNRRDRKFAFAWDGKSTLGKSIGVSRRMWEKAREQAGGERPLLPLRFYDTEKLDVGEDLVVLGLHDFAEMAEAANRVEPVRIFLFHPPPDPFTFMPTASPPQQSLMIRDGRIIRDVVVSITQREHADVLVEVDGTTLHGPVEIYVDGTPYVLRGAE